MHMTKETLRRRGVLTTTRVRGKGPQMDDGDRQELATLLALLAPNLMHHTLSEPAAAE
jgi:4-hydroxy-tetrahydrodipicolinate synthase